MTREEEREIRKIINSIIEKEMADKLSSLEKSVKKDTEQNIKKLEKTIQEIIDKAAKDSISKQELKTLLKKAFVKQFRFMWEKSNFVTSYIDQL